MTDVDPSPSRTAGARGTGWARVLVTVALLLVWNDLAVPRLPGEPWVRAAANVALVTLLVLAARTTGVGRAELGLGRTTWWTGLRWGGGALLLAVAVYAVLLAVPAGRALLADPRAAQTSTADLVLRAAVFVPIGTVACEELAFRGVLHGLARRVLGRRGTIALGAVAFSAWHVAVALGTAAPGLPADLGGATATSAVAVLVVTLLGGAVLGWTREHTGSLLAPVGIHLGTNVVGVVAALVATR